MRTEDEIRAELSHWREFREKEGNADFIKTVNAYITMLLWVLGE